MLVVCQTDISRVHSTNIRTMSEQSPTNVRLIVKQKLSVFAQSYFRSIHFGEGRDRKNRRLSTFDLGKVLTKTKLLMKVCSGRISVYFG